VFQGPLVVRDYNNPSKEEMKRVWGAHAQEEVAQWRLQEMPRPAFLEALFAKMAELVGAKDRHTWGIQEIAVAAQSLLGVDCTLAAYVDRVYDSMHRGGREATQGTAQCVMRVIAHYCVICEGEEEAPAFNWSAGQ
jgi:hypothetical protein